MTERSLAKITRRETKKNKNKKRRETNGVGFFFVKRG